MTGRAWMAIRDFDIAAEIIGIRPLRTKLLAFAVSSFYCGVAGALYVFTYVGNADTEAFDLIRSFTILFMIIMVDWDPSWDRFSVQHSLCCCRRF